MRLPWLQDPEASIFGSSGSGQEDEPEEFFKDLGNHFSHHWGPAPELTLAQG